jgi:DUF4097 and DUF4098 domain-containing protein YvlB
MSRSERSAHQAGVAMGLAFFLSASFAAVTQAQQAERYELSGRDIAIYNLVGEVTVQQGRGNAVVVEMVRGGRDAGELSVETGPIRGAETLRIIYPDDRIIYPELNRGSRTELRVRSDGTFSDSDRGDRDWGRGDRISIRGGGDGLEAYADMTISVPAGQQVAVYLAAGEAQVMDVDGTIRIDTHSAPVRASGTSGSLIVDVGSGSVDVTSAQGDVDVDTGSGGVDVRTVAGGWLRVDTGSGSVMASDIDVTDLEIDTGSGRIEADRVVAANVRLDTGSGSISLELLRDADDIEIDTGSGSVTLTVPDGFGTQVEIDTGSGGIEVDMPVTWDRDHVTGTIGDGVGRLTIDTGSGSVRIRQG